MFLLFIYFGGVDGFNLLCACRLPSTALYETTEKLPCHMAGMALKARNSFKKLNPPIFPPPHAANLFHGIPGWGWGGFGAGSSRRG